MKMSIKFFMSSNADNLRAINPDVTIEAEYGDEVVEGRLGTMAHHGKRGMNPAPCLYVNGLYSKAESVGLSHIDLDTIGGCMAVLGIKPSVPDFWYIAAFVDVAGPHKIGKVNTSEEVKLQLAAYWAWSKGHRVFAPKDGSVAEVTEQVMEACEAIEKILNGDEKLLQGGKEFAAGEDLLNKSSFVETFGCTILRVSSDFCNHLYTTPDGKICDSVVSFNTMTGAITLSFSESDESRNACEIMQEHFGNLAGGTRE
jgi:hypothetical protein